MADPFNFKIPKEIQFDDKGSDPEVFNKTNGWGSPDFYAQKRSKEKKQKLEAIEEKLRRRSSMIKENLEAKQVSKKKGLPPMTVRPTTSKPVEPSIVARLPSGTTKPKLVPLRATSQPPKPQLTLQAPTPGSRTRSNSQARAPAPVPLPASAIPTYVPPLHGMALRGRSKEKKEKPPVPPAALRFLTAPDRNSYKRASPVVRRAGVKEGSPTKNARLSKSPTRDAKSNSVKGFKAHSTYKPGLKSTENTPKATTSNKVPVRPAQKKEPVQKENDSRVDKSGQDVLNKRPINRRFSFMLPTLSSRRRSQLPNQQPQ
ncbi:unnamed protein product [Bursaphelenchus okinawaensis]|uniref:Uncharacterized protein n=1 Tax=Bursaphelenchus okinawaensis TaxID=465554 RepID=A0A811JS57_9BILA|nr:unnamed protein product [Bursaphelenchus okinawaensis]CAG9080726.1 unnamed protein product [Bursaphelenchus okinawaensis]